ncbi:MAG TPA: efflux RND transporter periplasmic adaptor subunit [Candidatus Eisenbacteria bacterium]|jgi:RND family efflux transporter MFP subunit|nr:efflux RND transporter periplasmic adaptor subunit [Candidatus Eisenbacteria bacterium]
MATPLSSPKHDLASLRIHEGERKGSKLGKGLAIFFGVLVILGGISGAVFALWKPKPVVEVTTVHKPAGAGGREALLNASGYVTPRRRATIAAKITGRVTGVHFDEGTRVQQGQLLATLDDSDVRRALDSAKADRNSAQAAIADLQVQLRNSQIELRRAEQLQKAGVQTQEQLDNARTNTDSLQAKIELAKAQVAASDARISEAQQAVDNCTIRAPFAGIVVSKDAQVGEMVSPISAGGGFTRTGIATIVDMNSNEIEVDVNESYIARVKDGQPVNAILDAYPDWEIPSKVRTIIPSADRQKATVKVRISFLKLDPRILPDMGIKVTFLGAETEKKPGSDNAPAAPLVSQSAVRDDGGKKIVFLVKDDHLERRAVTIGGNHGSDAEILAGLNVGDTVVTKGPQDLHDGQVVEVKK